ncbi:teichoic acids export ABC transporter ATP-binding subunit TagH [Bacillus sp. es.034]|uniref:teichoic acids export ABC transporter ATP-binding subunit TagH n=1 Tax=Bacillus sp. es.034 TaxID=1761763 RepID=UPI000C01ED72|nr:teichoic acids export ABC transporter ATP-binding subunit TagH [Bacillus sp. es.034]PFG04412.1 teichoic acid transport system ATP-binding protein [Bacillus sp. es.034]
MKPKVTLKNVSKKYTLYRKKSDKLLDVFSVNKRSKNFFALKNVSLEVFEGETIGVVGINGSGKSTLSSILAQIIPPSSGEIIIDGEPSLIAISAGLNNNLSGLENIELKCLMLGLSKEEIKSLKPEIIEFADIGDFIGQPVKNYSSGMKSRLGFAISVYTQPDLLIVDEALSVGDQTFYDKCLVKINEFKEQGKTIFFISHSISQISKMADRVMWLHFGELKKFGEAKEVIKEYQEFIKWFNQKSKLEKNEYKKQMLTSQSQNINKTDLGSRSNKYEKKPNKFSNALFYLQLFIVLFGLFVSGTTLFFDAPLKKLNSYISFPFASELSSDHDKEKKDPETSSQEINRKGYIQVENGVLYEDEKLEVKKEELPFSTEVLVKELIDKEYYRVLYQGENYFVKADTLTTEVNKKDVSSLSFEEQLYIFNEPVVSSYSYFTAFFDSSYDEITSSLKGLTDEKENQKGERYLLYGYDNVTYRLNSDDNSDAIIFSGLNFNQELIDLLEQKAKLISKNEELYLVETEQYNWIYNLENNELMLEKKKSTEEGDQID